MWLFAALATFTCLVGVNRLLAGPSFVDRVTMVNPTAYTVDVEVTGADRHGWLQLGEADKRATTVFEVVLDQGSTWVVRLANGEGGELRFTRDELVRARSARRDGEIELDPVTGQESHMIVRAAAADALVLVRRGEGALGAGTRVDYLRLRY